ncbi:hypothetical protein HMF3257_08040 [Spirosoma telluris]|uniref:Uncharacterized protein n=1 Tax=Spirosoma telluris TaxID=2183553 RepID=A0A327NZQ2_9BACT|nr:hypothetical protein HMF3257_08040 [Spirosoma telluris]
MIESFFVVSLIIVDVESPAIFVESVVIVESVTVVDVSVVSVLVLEQAVAKAIIERRKKADFTMVAMKFELVRLFSC